MIKIVYIAGAYSADNVLDVFDNMRIGMDTAAAVFDAGFSPFCPWLDYHFCLRLPKDRLSIEKFYKYSMDFLKVSDAVLVTPNPKNYKSKGTKHELACAEDLKIPIFHSIGDLLNASRPQDRTDR